MKLLLRRDQKSGFTGSVTFTLSIRADLTKEELSSIEKYKLRKTMLYSRGELAEAGSGLLGIASRMAFKMMNISVSVEDLVAGKHLEFKDIMEMLACIEQIKVASQNFKSVLEVASQFGGEEVVEV